MLVLISLLAIAGASILLAVWYWGQRRADTTVVEQVAKNVDPGTEFISREEMFMAADQGRTPEVPPTMILTRTDPDGDDEQAEIPATEYLSRDEALGQPRSTQDLEDGEAPTRVFSRDLLPGVHSNR